MAQPPQPRFHEQLVLNRWMLRHFTPGNFEGLARRLREDDLEGLHADGRSRYFHALDNGLVDPARLTGEELDRYDRAIVGHWQAITRRRNTQAGTELRMKYFQYLSLLFTEIYLDRYFHRRQEMLDGLNAELAGHAPAAGFRPYVADDLNRIAFWNATGSGKTLLLHVNIRQYLAHAPQPDRIILLLPPGEELARQHLAELHLSGIDAQAFDRNRGGTVLKRTVDVLSISKLGDETKEEVVAVDSFAGRNLVLVDEGHKGTGSAGGAWMDRRAALTDGGFAFEYSATFSQSVANGGTVDKAETELRNAKARLEFGKPLRNLTPGEMASVTLTESERNTARRRAVREAYAKAILFDYSYRHFHGDGYGKDAMVLNIDRAAQETYGQLYFTACLLTFYQQLWLWETHREQIAEFNIEKPLWVFVGNTVTGRGEDSDVMEVVQRLATFLNEREAAERWIADLIENRATMLTRDGGNFFADKFQPLAGLAAENVYADILKRVFNATAPLRLRLTKLGASIGELSLRVGTAPAFGVINVGKADELLGIVREDDRIQTATEQFASGLFDSANDKDSRITLVIGSRKFSEGWSSWRVSTMGLLNIGQGEGSQIIQLFGRGVRLKGKVMSLKRSEPGDRPPGIRLELLERLNLFGVRANYMATFRELLSGEGIQSRDSIIEISFEPYKTVPTKPPLKILKLADGRGADQAAGFKRSVEIECLKLPARYNGRVGQPRVTLDLFPRIAAIGGGGAAVVPRNPVIISRIALEAFDWETVYRDVAELVALKGHTNLRLTADILREFCLTGNDWYTLYAPLSDVSLKSLGDLLRQQSILARLLVLYAEKLCGILEGAFQGEHLAISVVDDSTGPMSLRYRFEYSRDDQDCEAIERLRFLQTILASGQFGQIMEWDAPNLVAISFEQHLYAPLISPNDASESPLPFRMIPSRLLNAGEAQFVQDLKGFYESKASKQILAGRDLFLLRNAERHGRGIGFATAGNFYPDFLLWLVERESGMQWLAFIDPKGLWNIGPDDPKIRLHREVKQIEARIGDPDLELSAFIISTTPFGDRGPAWSGETVESMAKRNVLFRDDGRHDYLVRIFQRMTTPAMQTPACNAP